MTSHVVANVPLKMPGLVARTNSRYPRWALDPFTLRLMTCPVVVRAPCNHVVDKTTWEAWVEQGHTCCLLCQAPMTQIAASPDKELADRIRKLKNGNEEEEEEEFQMTCMELNCIGDLSNDSQKNNVVVDFEAVSDDKRDKKPEKNIIKAQREQVKEEETLKTSTTSKTSSKVSSKVSFGSITTHEFEAPPSPKANFVYPPKAGHQQKKGARRTSPTNSPTTRSRSPTRGRVVKTSDMMRRRNNNRTLSPTGFTTFNRNLRKASSPQRVRIPVLKKTLG